MKKILVITSLFFVYSSYGQQGEELLVYSLKGNVTVIENDKESKVKIGKVLKPGSTLKTQKLAKLTMVCKEGKALTVTKEGSFPIIRWKDSCETNNHNSVTSKYFKYIWEQLYMRSEDFKKNSSGDIAAVVRNEAPVRGEDDMEILFEEALDTVYYAAGDFPLSWRTNKDYSGKYYFRLYDSKAGKVVYKDSIVGNTLSIENLKRYMKPGSTYQWSVATKKTGEYTAGILKLLLTKNIDRQIINFQKAVDVPEDAAARYFRVAYLLQNGHYLANAFMYYQKAIKAAPNEEFYKEILLEFKKTFQIRLW